MLLFLFFSPQRYTALFLRSKCQTDVKMTCLQATMWFLFMFHQPLKTSQRCSAVRTYKAFLFSPRRLCIVQFPGLRFKYICNSCGHFCVLLLPHTYEFFHVSSLLIYLCPLPFFLCHCNVFVEETAIICSATL